MPTIEECDELVTAMEAVTRTEDDFHDTCRRLPHVDDIQELAETMQWVIKLADEFEEAMDRIRKG